VTIVNMRQKIDEDRRCSSEDMIADAQRHTQADTPPYITSALTFSDDAENATAHIFVFDYRHL